MKHKISKLIMYQNFQGLYVGFPKPDNKQDIKKYVLERIGSLHPDMNSYEDWTDDFPVKKINKYHSYGNIVLAVIDFLEDPDIERAADWTNVNIMFIYWPALGETIEGKIEELLKEKEYKTHECWF